MKSKKRRNRTDRLVASAEVVVYVHGRLAEMAKTGELRSVEDDPAIEVAWLMDMLRSAGADLLDLSMPLPPAPKAPPRPRARGQGEMAFDRPRLRLVHAR